MGGGGCFCGPSFPAVHLIAIIFLSLTTDLINYFISTKRGRSSSMEAWGHVSPSFTSNRIIKIAFWELNLIYHMYVFNQCYCLSTRIYAL